MINAELYSGNIKGKKMIINLIPWQDSDYGRELLQDEKENIRIFKYEKLENKYIRIICDNDSYIKIPNFYKTYFTISSDDNYNKGELTVSTKELREVFIPIEENEIYFQNKSSLFRPFIIDVISNNENIINRYCIIVQINYKDNGVINNENFDFDYSVRINKVFKKNVTYGLIDYAFFGYCLWLIINIIKGNCIFELINNPTTIVLILTYLIGVIVKTRYIGNTIVNKLLFVIGLKKRDYYTNHELKNMYKKYKETNKSEIL